jgi:hypothetical protein
MRSKDRHGADPEANAGTSPTPGHLAHRQDHLHMQPHLHRRRPCPLWVLEQRVLFAELEGHLVSMALFRVNTGMREQEVVNLRWQSTSPEKPRKVTIAGLSHLFLAGPASCGIMARHGVESAGVNASLENLSCFASLFTTSAIM